MIRDEQNLTPDHVLRGASPICYEKDVTQKMVDDYRVYSFNFVDENKKEALYWRDVGTLEAFYDANMDIVSVSPVFNLYDSEWPIRTHQRQYPPAKFVFAEAGRTGQALDSIVSSGCIISGGSVKGSVLWILEGVDGRTRVFSNTYQAIETFSGLGSDVAYRFSRPPGRCAGDRNGVSR